MHTYLAKFCGYTSLAAILTIATINLNVSIAGGDPNIKDKKIYQNKSNIKQHNHSNVYKTKRKNVNSNKSKNIANSKTSKENQGSTVSLNLRFRLEITPSNDFLVL